MLWPNHSRTMPPISSPFGPRTGGAFSFHHGTDFVGFSTVHAVASGRVTLAGWMNSSAGNAVAVDYAPGITLVYMHLGKVTVTRGQHIAEGQPLGTVGSTGNATGPCVHVEVRLQGTSVDPVPYIRARLTGGTPAAAPDKEEDMPLTDRDVDRIVDGVWSKTMHGGGELADGHQVPHETAAERLRQIRRSTAWGGSRILAIFQSVRKGVSGQYHHGDMYRINQEGRDMARKAVLEGRDRETMLGAMADTIKGLSEAQGLDPDKVLDMLDKRAGEWFDKHTVAVSIEDDEK